MPLVPLQPSNIGYLSVRTKKVETIQLFPEHRMVPRTYWESVDALMHGFFFQSWAFLSVGWVMSWLYLGQAV